MGSFAMKNPRDKLALNTATLGHNLEGQGAGWSAEQTVDACAARGLGGVVFWRREITNPQKIGEYTRAAGLEVTGLCRTPYLVGEEAEMDDLPASIDMAGAMGAKVLTIVVGGVEPNTKGIAPTLAILRKRLEASLKLVEKTNITLAIEPLHPMTAGNRSALTRTEDAVEILNEFDHNQLQLAVDVYHVWWDLGLADALARAKGRIAGFHLCDWLRDTNHMFLDRGMMGDGVADLTGLSALVASAGFDGIAEVEIFSQNNWWKRDPNEVLDVMIARYQDLSKATK